MQVIELLTKLSDQLSIYGRSILSICLVIILCLLQSCSGINKSGAATPDQVVEQYLLALEDRDQNSVIRLFPENSAVKQQVQAKITKFGGYKIQDRQVKYTKSKPTRWNARVQGFYLDRLNSRHRFDEAITIEYQSKGQVKLYGGRWYLLF
jgi:hypothetical protein